MKIWCQLPVQLPLPEFKPFHELIQKHYELVKGPDTEIVIRDVPTGLRTGSLSYLGLKLIQDREVLRSMLQAEGEGCDAVAGACYTDSAILAARSLMDIPVLGAAETSMYLARMMGSRFAIITTNPENIPGIEQYVKELGMSSFALSYRLVRCLLQKEETFWQALLSGNHGSIIDAFKDTAQGCIEEGADVLIVGCGALAPLLTVNGVREIDGVPVIDPVEAGLKFAEMMVRFRASGMPVRSHKGLFLQAPKENILDAFNLLGLT